MAQQACTEEAGPEHAPAVEAETDVVILPGLENAWLCFVGTLNQWRVVAGMAGVFYEGIDAAALLATMDMLGIEQDLRPELFWQMQILEGEARKCRNKANKA